MLLVVTVLFLIVAEFRWDSILQLKRADNLKKLATCRYAARAGIAHMLSLLRQASLCYGPGDSWYLFHPQSGNAAKKFYVDKEQETWYQISCEDEDGKLNLNDTELNEELPRLFQLFGYAKSRAEVFRDCLLDWQDTNNEHRLNGREEGYYQSLRPPYHCKNAPLQSLQELFLIYGLREEQPARFFGDNQGKKDLRQLATVFRQDYLVNINTSPADIMTVYLELSNEQIQTVMLQRRSLRAFQDTKEVEKIGIKKHTDRMKVTSNIFRIRAGGGTRDAPFVREIEATVQLGEKREVTFLYYLER